LAYYSDRYLPARLPERLPKRVADQLVRAALPGELPADAVVQLVIRADDTDLVLRELAAYLELTDRVFGRLTTSDLPSYVRRRGDQLRASFRPGSLEIILEAVVSHGDTLTALAVLRFVLKYVPASLKDFASAYRELEEARFTRARRKQLRDKAVVDEELESLEPKQRNDLVQYLDAVYVREQRTLPAARRFAVRHVRELFFRLKRDE
jgi:hypothetical protein